MFIEYIFLFFIYLFWIREFVKNRDHSYDHIQSNIQITGVINSPLVSVIIPARNEMENISTCLTSIIRQNYNELEIIVIDDGSKDGTYRAVEDMQKNNAKLKLIKNGNLPEGWIGKNYAIHLGMKEAGGEWLLFLDADTELYPDAISKVLGFSLSNNINMVSFSPEQVLRGFWESAVQPVIYEFLSYRYNYNWINSPNADAAAANGQFILIQRSVYEDAGGHETIRDKILEDVSLAENVKKKGFKIYFSYGREIVRCRMYKSLREIVQGWTKNLFTLLGYDFKTLFKIVLHLIFFSLLPFILFLYSLLLTFIEPGFTSGLFLIATLCLVSLIVVTKLRRFDELKYPNASAFFYPIGIGVSTILFLLSAYRGKISREIEWKGRKYSV